MRISLRAAIFGAAKSAGAGLTRRQRFPSARRMLAKLTSRYRVPSNTQFERDGPSAAVLVHLPGWPAPQLERSASLERLRLARGN